MWSSRGSALRPGAVRPRRGVADPSGMVLGHKWVWGGSASWICGGGQQRVIGEAQGGVEHAHNGGGWWKHP